MLKAKDAPIFVTVILALILGIFIANPASASDQKIKDHLKICGPDTIQIITMQSGSKLMGRIISVGDNKITFKSDLGETIIDVATIKEIKEVPATAVKKGNYWFENPNATRLYFSPTARMLKQGQGYFSDYYIFFPGVTYGITNNINLGFGMSLFPGVDINDQVFYFTPKIGLSATKNSCFSVGALILALPEIDHERNTLGIAFGSGTIGSPDASLTFGLGYGFVNGDFADKPAVVIGGEKRFARRISFVSENWIFPNVDQVPISYGVRFFGEGLSVDLAFFNLLGDDAIFPGIPWIDFVFNF
jgi:hypothetical protein